MEHDETPRGHSRRVGPRRPLPQVHCGTGATPSFRVPVPSTTRPRSPNPPRHVQGAGGGEAQELAELHRLPQQQHAFAGAAHQPQHLRTPGGWVGHQAGRHMRVAHQARQALAGVTRPPAGTPCGTESRRCAGCSRHAHQGPARTCAPSTNVSSRSSGRASPSAASSSWDTTSDASRRASTPCKQGAAAGRWAGREVACIGRQADWKARRLVVQAVTARPMPVTAFHTRLQWLRACHATKHPPHPAAPGATHVEARHEARQLEVAFHQQRLAAPPPYGRLGLGKQAAHLALQPLHPTQRRPELRAAKRAAAAGGLCGVERQAGGWVGCRGLRVCVRV